MGADVDLGEVTSEQRVTMLALLSYSNPQGIHTDEARWRNFARTELSLRDERIKQLERLNATLAAEIDLMAPVVQAAIGAVNNGKTVPLSVIDAVYDYKIAKKGQQA